MPSNATPLVNARRAVVILGGAVVVFAVAWPALTSNSFWLNLATDMAIWATLAIGLNAVLGWAGLLDLGYIAFFAIGGYCYAILSEHNVLQFWPSLIVGIGVSAVAAIIIGVPSLRLDSDYLAIMTLGFGEIIYIAANNMGITGGVNGLFSFTRPSVFGKTLQSSKSFYLLAIGLLVVCAVVTGFVRYSRFGHAWMSLKTDELSARSLGVAIWRTKLYAYMYGSIWGALAGAVFVAKQSIISPTSITLDQSFNVLSAVVIGGMGSIWGAAIGGVAYIFISETFQGVGGSFSGIVFGGALLLVILIRPKGLVPVEAIRRLVRRALILPAGHAAPSETADGWAGLRHSWAEPADRPAIRARDVDIAYGGVKAVDHASLDCHAGSVTALIGPNGAGKTTLLNGLSGFVRLRGGRIELVRGDHVSNLTGVGADRRARAGFGRAFQTPRLDLDQSVRENARRGALASSARRRETDRRTRQVLELVGLAELGDVRAGELSYGDQRRCEIARALITEPSFLLLDEPSSGMNDTETEELGELIKQVAGAGIGVVVVEHDMALVRQVAEQVVAMDNGRVIAVGTADEVLADQTVRQRYLGEA